VILDFKELFVRIFSFPPIAINYKGYPLEFPYIAFFDDYGQCWYSLNNPKISGERKTSWKRITFHLFSSTFVRHFSFLYKEMKKTPPVFFSAISAPYFSFLCKEMKKGSPPSIIVRKFWYFRIFIVNFSEGPFLSMPAW